MPATLTKPAGARVRSGQGFRATRPGLSNGGGGGGSNLGQWKKFGDGNGGYNTAQNRFLQGSGPFEGVTDEFCREVGVSKESLGKPQLITSAQAATAQTYATKAPQYVENAKKFYCGATAASNGDLGVKKAHHDYRMKAVNNLFEQEELDHEFGQEMMQIQANRAGLQWKTNEVFKGAQASIKSWAQASRSGA